MGEKTYLRVALSKDPYIQDLIASLLQAFKVLTVISVSIKKIKYNR